MIWLILSALAFADPQEEDRKVIYKQKTEIDFEGVELEGQLIKPQGSIITERQSAAFNPLIKLRTDFKQEMTLSVEEMK